jgi:diguanylate cyclase (GGDEF)-like protein
MLDIDKFKVLNDTYGHQTGDEVLKQVARVLMREIRSGDLACRYGGEEFTVILPEAAPENAFKRADRIRAAIAELPVAPGQSAGGGVTVSFGVAGFPEHGATAPELLRAADAALYRQTQWPQPCRDGRGAGGRVDGRLTT